MKVVKVQPAGGAAAPSTSSQRGPGTVRKRKEGGRELQGGEVKHLKTDGKTTGEGGGTDRTETNQRFKLSVQLQTCRPGLRGRQVGVSHAKC